ncbi:tyrosinase family protein, partial [Nostoc sp. CHAB 5715]|uniref:tyrosinase family protein n=1 Tax=Nostoc sp. CHAB 5715 TaxID=2780400 RepID=UPI001E3FB5FB
IGVIPEGQKDLQALKVALQKMRELGCTDPASWYFQSAIHWVPDPQNFVAQNFLCPIYTNDSYSNAETKPQIDDLLKFWKQCTHQPGSGIHFLPWHRLYLYYFEQIVRNLSGKSDFALPYWDYTNSDSKYKSIPEALRLPANPRINSLYEEFRLPSLNIKTDPNEDPQIDPSTYETLVLNKQKAYETIVYSVFTSQLERSPHGTIHNYVGGDFPRDKFNDIWQRSSPYDIGVGLMKDVTTAGFDPIFWLHHSSIDRYWESWTKAKNVKVSETELAAVEWPYRFFNAQKQVVEYKTPAEIINAAYNVNYTYDKYDEIPPRPLELLRSSPQPQARLEVSSVQKAVVSKDFKTKLTDETTIVVVPVRLSTRSGERAALTAPSFSIAAEKGYVLEIQVSFQGQPRGTYNVYVNLPDKKATVDKEAYYAGAISFFELSTQERKTKTLLFDITDELAKEVEKGEQLSENQGLKVTFFKQNGSSATDIIVEKVSLRSY